MAAARDVGLKRVYAYRNGEVRAKPFRLDEVTEVSVQDILG